MSNLKRLYTGGELIEYGEARDVISPATGLVVGTIAGGGENDTLGALGAAPATLDFWRTSPVDERISWMLKLRDECPASGVARNLEKLGIGVEIDFDVIKKLEIA